MDTSVPTVYPALLNSLGIYIPILVPTWIIFFKVNTLVNNYRLNNYTGYNYDFYKYGLNNYDKNNYIEKEYNN